MDKRIISKVDDLLNRVPGYAGYRDKEDRRDDDRRLREDVASSLDQIVTQLTRVGARLAQERRLGQISAVERLTGATRHLSDRVRTASYGYGGIFTDQSVDEYALEQLRQFDVRFQQEVGALGDIASRLETSPEGPLDVDVNAYQDELNRLGALFDGRRTVVETAKPNRDAAVLSLLDANPTPSKASPLTTLRRGEALSLGTTNHLVDATVTISEPGGDIRLSRIGSDDQGASIWLLGSTNEEINPARLVEQASSSAPGTPVSAEIVVDAGSGPQAGVPGQYAYTAGAEGSVSFWYAVGNESRSFTGETIAEDEVVVYGQA